MLTMLIYLRKNILVLLFTGYILPFCQGTYYFVVQNEVKHDKAKDACTLRGIGANGVVARQCDPYNLATMPFNKRWNNKFIWIDKVKPSCSPGNCLALSVNSSERRNVTLVCIRCSREGLVMCESDNKPSSQYVRVDIVRDPNDPICHIDWVRAGKNELLVVMERMQFKSATIYCAARLSGSGLMDITYTRSNISFLNLLPAPFYWISTPLPGNTSYAHYMLINGAVGVYPISNFWSESICQREYHAPSSQSIQTSTKSLSTTSTRLPTSLTPTNTVSTTSITPSTSHKCRLSMTSITCSNPSSTTTSTPSTTPPTPSTTQSTPSTLPSTTSITPFMRSATLSTSTPTPKATPTTSTTSTPPSTTSTILSTTLKIPSTPSATTSTPPTTTSSTLTTPSTTLITSSTTLFSTSTTSPIRTPFTNPFMTSTSLSPPSTTLTKTTSTMPTSLTTLTASSTSKSTNATLRTLSSTKSTVIVLSRNSSFNTNHMTRNQNTAIRTTTTSRAIPTLSTTTFPHKSDLTTVSKTKGAPSTTIQKATSLSMDSATMSTTSKTYPMPFVSQDIEWTRYRFNEYYVNFDGLAFEESRRFCKEQLNATLVFFHTAGLYVRIVRDGLLNISSGSLWVASDSNSSDTTCFKVEVDNYDAVLYGLDIDCKEKRGSICARAIQLNNTEDLISEVMKDPEFIRMIEGMTVKKNSTKKNLRRYISVRDKSAEQAGTAVSIVLMVSTFAFFLMCDVPRIKDAIQRKYKKQQIKEKRRARRESEA